MKQSVNKIFYVTGASLALIGIVGKLLAWFLAPYIFSIGAALLIYIPLKQVISSKETDVRQRRLARSGLFAALLLALGAYFMFINSNSWVVAVLIYSLSTLFLSFRGE